MSGLDDAYLDSLDQFGARLARALFSEFAPDQQRPDAFPLILNAVAQWVAAAHRAHAPEDTEGFAIWLNLCAAAFTEADHGDPATSELLERALQLSRAFDRQGQQ